MKLIQFVTLIAAIIFIVEFRSCSSQTTTTLSIATDDRYTTDSVDSVYATDSNEDDSSDSDSDSDTSSSSSSDDINDDSSSMDSDSDSDDSSSSSITVTGDYATTDSADSNFVEDDDDDDSNDDDSNYSDDEMVKVTDEAASDEKSGVNAGESIDGGLKSTEEESDVAVEAMLIVSGLLVIGTILICMYVYSKNHRGDYGGIENNDENVEIDMKQNRSTEMTAIMVNGQD